VDSRTRLITLEEPCNEEEIRRAIFPWRRIKHRVQMRLTWDSINISGQCFDKISWISFKLFVMGILIYLSLIEFILLYYQKITGARHIGDFRPISLINGILKIISKVLQST